MSHYSCIVIVPSSELNNVEGYLNTVLEPFDENKEVPHVAIPAEDLPLDLAKHNEEYPTSKYDTVEQFARDWHGYHLDEQGNAISNYNPDSKWDWWVIGGRWSKTILSKSGQLVNLDRVKNIDFDGMREKHLKQAEQQWKDAENETDRVMKYFRHGVEPDTTYEQHIADNDFTVSAYAVINKDGQWGARGEMGWFGMSNDNETNQEWNSQFYDRFIKDLDPEDMLVVLDLHI